MGEFLSEEDCHIRWRNEPQGKAKELYFIILTLLIEKHRLEEDVARLEDKLGDRPAFEFGVDEA